MIRISVWNRIVIIGVTLVLALIPSYRAFASSIYVSIRASAGAQWTSANPGTDMPMIGQFSGGGTLGYWITPSLLLGVSSEYRLINQYSETNTLNGNLQGNRLNMASPTVGLKIGNLLLIGDFQFLGDYNITAMTISGKGNLKLASPLGGRLMGLFRWGNHVSFGPFVEYLTFQSGNFDYSTDGSLQYVLGGVVLSLHY